MKKLLMLTVLSAVTVTLTGCECWDNFWNRGSKYSDPAVYAYPPCPPVTSGCAMPACPTSCGPVSGVPDYVPGPGN
jgi:hypothetical protein